MDSPTEWPLIIKLLAGWGPLGIGWLWAERRRARGERDHHDTRTAHEKAVTAADKRHQEALAAKDEAHHEAMAAKDEVHHKQLQQVYDRMSRIVENQSRQAHRLADGVVDRIRRSKEDET